MRYSDYREDGIDLGTLSEICSAQGRLPPDVTRHFEEIIEEMKTFAEELENGEVIVQPDSGAMESGAGDNAP